MRAAVYTDYAYHRVDGAVYAERAFAIFLARLARHLGGLKLIGRLDPGPGRARYPLGDDVDLVALPYYESLGSPWRAIPAMTRSLRRFWRSVDGVDVVWLLGPHPLALAFAALACARGRAVVLGVRQDLPAYARARHPRRPLVWLAASALERGWRLLARVLPVVVVGPALARTYRRSPARLEVAVSMVDEEEIVDPESARRSCGEEIRLLSVGRVDAEKNPLLLADVLARLRSDGDERWRLQVCGEGPLTEPLQRRLSELGVADAAELRGYVPFAELRAEYERADLLLHVSRTEGLPQVLLEAFAAALPVVATDVGGVREAVGGCVSLVPPDDPDSAAEALRRLAGDQGERTALARAGHEYVRSHTIDAECRRVVQLLQTASAGGRSADRALP